MRYFKLGLVLAALLSMFTAGAAFAQDFPEPTGKLVNDFAGVISPQGEAELENILLQLERDTTSQVAVVTITTLGDESIDTYAVGLFEKWGIGKEGADNGILFITAVEERKVRIEVGYGLEPVITDGRAGRILDDNVLPAYRDGDYEAGIFNGVAAIEGYIRQGTPPADSENGSAQESGGFGLVGVLLIVLGIASIYVFGFMARSKTFWAGGVWGAVVGVIIGLVIGGILGVILLALGMAGFGLFLDWILSRNYKALKAMSQPTSWGRTWGGFHGPYGGSGGGFGGRGGGFGGFGGGMSGGGGAGRGW